MQIVNYLQSKSFEPEVPGQNKELCVGIFITLGESISKE